MLDKIPDNSILISMLILKNKGDSPRCQQEERTGNHMMSMRAGVGTIDGGVGDGDGDGRGGYKDDGGGG